MLWFCQRCGKDISERSAYCGYCGEKQGIVHAAKSPTDQDTSNRTTSAVGKTCPYCQVTVKPGVKTLRCPTCGIVHHSACWQENGSKCTTYGCNGAIQQPDADICRDQSVTAMCVQSTEVGYEADKFKTNHLQCRLNNEEKNDSSRNAIIVMFLLGIFGVLLLMAETIK